MNKNLLILVIIIILAVGGIYYFQSTKPNGIQNSQVTTQVSGAQNQIMFNIDAKRWQFAPSVINVKKGQRVKIVINNIDTIHGINLPEFAGAIGNDSIEFTADKTGEFPFFCKNFCGDGHTGMTGKVIVTE